MFSKQEFSSLERVNTKLLMTILLGISVFLLFFILSINTKTNDSLSNLSLQPQKNQTPKSIPIATTGLDNNLDNAEVDGIVAQALTFRNMLTSSQQSELQLTYSSSLAGKWSNLPCGSTCRNGIQFGDLSDTELAAAQTLIAMALNDEASLNGYEEFEQIRIAEDYLNEAGGGSNYTSDLRWIAFLNEPSESGAWMLQFGGHHYAANIAYNGESVIGATPFFVALEPTTFTYNGTYYEPMEDEKEAFQNMLASLSSSEFSTAKLSTSFSDVLMAPGESNGNTNSFPTTKQGLQCSNLTTTQKGLVVAAMANYVNDMDDQTAASVLAKYTDELDDTYIAFTGNATVGSASTFLSSNTNYVRIDGPSVWIEFACQNGVVISDQIHYHSVWRDHDSDYGVDLTGSAIDKYVSTGINNSYSESVINIFPNPASDVLSINFGKNLSDAKITIVDLSGKLMRVYSNIDGESTELNITTLPTGNYIVSIDSDDLFVSRKFIKQ